MSIETEVQRVEADVIKVYKFTRGHLILVGALSLVLLACVYLWDSRRADAAEAHASASAALAAQQDKFNEQLQVQAKQQVEELRQENAAIRTEVAALTQAVAARNTALAVHTAAVPTLSTPELSKRWGALAQEPAPILTTDGNLSVGVPLAQKSVIALMTVPVLTKNNEDLTAAVVKEKTAVTNAEQALTVEQDAHKSDVTTCTADKKALSDQVVVEKANARKGKLKWFGIGYAAGWVSKRVLGL